LSKIFLRLLSSILVFFGDSYSIKSIGTFLNVYGMKNTIRIPSPDIAENNIITGKLFSKQRPTTLGVTVATSPPIKETRLVAMTLACVGNA
jgi:hypothetical protein